MRILILLHLAAAVLLAACSGSSTGKSCSSADDCYDIAERDQITGTIECLDRTEAGYCTHSCSSDAECCSKAGECAENTREVCAPFENSPMQRCFIGCEDSDIGEEEGDAYCADRAGAGFVCRSTGGGAANRKVCFPSG